DRRTRAFHADYFVRRSDAAHRHPRSSLHPSGELLLAQGSRTSKVNVPGTTVGRGRGCCAVAAGGGPKSAVAVNTRWVFGSSSISPSRFPETASIAVAECASPLNVKMRLVAGSYSTASSSGGTIVWPSTRSDLRSNIVTVLSAPDVAKP